MSHYRLYGVIEQDDDTKYIDRPTWQQIEKSILELKKVGQGHLDLILLDAPDIGIQSCEIMMDNFKFIINALEVDEDDAHGISYNDNENKSESKTDILGDYWPNSMITTDISIALRVFKEFYNTGRVPEGLMW